MRKKLDIPPVFDAQTTPRKNDTIITQVREYTLITPLFGGGAVPLQYDPVTIVRGTEIRGQLRFWWRACQGGNFASLEKMKEAEDALWGKAHKKETKEPPEGQDKKTPPTVQISVEKSDEGEDVKPFKVEKNSSGNNAPKAANGIPGYAAFPLQPDSTTLKKYSRPEDVPVQPVRKGITFRLIISFPKEKRKDLEATLWAWETFGGLGARTRRGFGALRCTQITEELRTLPLNLPPATQSEAIDWLQKCCQKYVVAGSWPAHVPHLIPQPVQGTHFELINRASSQNTFDVWNDLINRLSWFRQMRPEPQNRARPGRSKWPEPDTIRYLLNQSKPEHKQPVHTPPIHKFPRAAFGLPLPFKFKDDNSKNPNDRKADPRKSVLQLEGFERFASPLILKPLACQGNMALGLAFILDSIDIKQIRTPLELRPQADFQGEEYIKKASAALGPREAFILTDSREDPPRSKFKIQFEKRIDQKTDILRVFLEYLAINAQ